MTTPLLDLPTAALLAIVAVYWLIVGAMVVRRRRRTRKMSGVVPEEPLERVLGYGFVAVVALWIALPWLALRHGEGWLALPGFARSDAATIVRGLAVVVAAGALYGSIRAWRQMGRHWTMAVTRDEATTLFTSGMFARVRHPIYTLSILLMLSSLVVVPNAPMLFTACAHFALMNAKARNEERFLLAAHGDAYADYCRRTGRFVPRVMQVP
ncbi:MAG: isoprenylcysteine carboxylmethyltransferase family protein [Proteobacteria bacterium]|nr:isoprenylcysteine carboxylmethyltransferase family protein [Pseudomonadota bacterium]